MSNIKTDLTKNLFRLNNTITVACLNENEFIKQFLQSKEGIFEEGLPDENNNSFISLYSYDNNSENSLNEKKEDYILNKNIFDTSLITLKNESNINSTNQTFREIKIIMDEVL
jgi:hypothetical protein